MQFLRTTLGYQKTLRLQTSPLRCHSPLGWSAGLSQVQPLATAAEFQLNVYRQMEPIQFLSDWTQPDWTQSDWGEALLSIEELPVAELPVAEVPVAEVPVAEVPVAETSREQQAIAQQPQRDVPETPDHNRSRRKQRSIAQHPQQGGQSAQKQQKSNSQPAKPKANQKANQKRTKAATDRKSSKRIQQPAIAILPELSDESIYPVVPDQLPLQDFDLESHNLESHDLENHSLENDNLESHSLESHSLENHNLESRSLEFFNLELDGKSEPSAQADHLPLDRFSTVESSNKASVDAAMNLLPPAQNVAKVPSESSVQIAPATPGQPIVAISKQSKSKKIRTKEQSRQGFNFDQETPSIRDHVLTEEIDKEAIDSQRSIQPLQTSKSLNKVLQRNLDSASKRELSENRENSTHGSSRSLTQDNALGFDQHQYLQAEESIDEPFAELQSKTEELSETLASEIILEELPPEAITAPSQVEQIATSSDPALLNQTVDLAPQLDSALSEPVSSESSNAFFKTQIISDAQRESIAVTSKQPKPNKSKPKGRSLQKTKLEREPPLSLDTASTQKNHEAIDSQLLLQPIQASELSKKNLQHDPIVPLQQAESPEDREIFAHGSFQSIAQDKAGSHDLTVPMEFNPVPKVTVESSTLGFSQHQHQQTQHQQTQHQQTQHQQTEDHIDEPFVELQNRINQDAPETPSDEIPSAELPAEAVAMPAQVEQERLPEQSTAPHSVEAVTSSSQIEQVTLSSAPAVSNQAVNLSPRLESGILETDLIEFLDCSITVSLHQAESIHPIDHTLVQPDRVSQFIHESQHSMHEAQLLASAAEAKELEAELLDDRISESTESAWTELQAASGGSTVEDENDQSFSPHTDSFPANVPQAFIDAKLSPQDFTIGGQVTVAGAEAGKAIDPSDTVPAMLTPGEFVINARDAQRHLSLLQQINQGENLESIARFANRSSEGEAAAEPPALDSIEKSPVEEISTAKVSLEKLSTVAGNHLLPQISLQISHQTTQISPDRLPEQLQVQRQHTPQPVLKDSPVPTDGSVIADSGFALRSLQSSALDDSVAPEPTYATPSLIFRAKAPAPSAFASAFSSIADWSSVEDLLGRSSESAASSEWSSGHAQRIQVQPLQGFAKGGEVMSPTSAPVSLPAATADSPAAIEPADQPAESATTENSSDDLEALAQEIYQRLCRRLEIERERCGVYSGRSPW